jgi:hypothetical protein
MGSGWRRTSSYGHWSCASLREGSDTSGVRIEDVDLIGLNEAFAAQAVCTENLIRVDGVAESPKLAECSGCCVSFWPLCVPKTSSEFFKR